MAYKRYYLNIVLIFVEAKCRDLRNIYTNNPMPFHTINRNVCYLALCKKLLIYIKQ